ncbi:hypothetical protein [Microbacterium lacus]
MHTLIDRLVAVFTRPQRRGVRLVRRAGRPRRARTTFIAPDAHLVVS